MNGWWIPIALVGIFVTWLALSYNRFVSQRALIHNSWSNIDVELRRRYDLIPNLVETVKGYARHERELLEDVTRRRSTAAATGGDAEEQAQAERPLVGSLRRLFAVAENYPDLKASQAFLDLQLELSITEDRLQAARRFYNNNVRDYNSRIQAFPSNLVASTFGFRLEHYFEVEEAIRHAPSVGFTPAGS